jgi:hypothetical protein
MDLNGHKTLEVPVARAYEIMTDPVVLTRTMPGLESLTAREPGVFDAQLELGVAAIKGRYEGEMRMVDADPPRSYRMVMEGQGPKGFVSVNMQVTLTPADTNPDFTDVHYEGEAHVGGAVAGVGQRVLGGVASLIMGKFFSALAKEAKAT